MSNDDMTHEDEKHRSERRGSFEINPPSKEPTMFGFALKTVSIASLVIVVWAAFLFVYKPFPRSGSDFSALNLQQELPSLDIKYPVQRLQPVEHRTFMAQCDETDLLCLQVATQDPAATFQMLSAAMSKNGERRYLLRIAVTPLDADDSPASPAPTRLQQTIAY